MRLLKLLADFRIGVFNIQDFDIASWGHQAACRAVCQAHDAGDHRGLLGLDDTRMMGLGEYRADFLVRDGFLRDASLAEEGKNRLAGSI